MSLIECIHRLLIEHCTRADDDEGSRMQRQRYLDRVRLVLSTSRLAPRTQHDVWAIGWDKPFFANNSAARVNKAVDLVRQVGLFDDPVAVASPKFFENEVHAGIEQGYLVGACKVRYRLERVQAYAQAVPRITEAVNHFHDDWQAGNLEAAELQARAVSIAEDIGVGGGPIGKVHGFGFTTACHLLADLGLPVFKPDMWVCRIVSSLPGVQAELRRAWRLGDGPVPFDFLEKQLIGSRAPDAYRRIVQPMMNALVAEIQALKIDAIDLTPAFLRARFVDWTLVHFAISAEVDVDGLKHRPLDLLCSPGGPAAPAHIRAMALWLRDGQIAKEAESALSKARRKLLKADTREKEERAERRLARLRPSDGRRERALATLAAYEDVACSAGWQIAAQYPEGFACKDGSTRWKYIRAARMAQVRVVAE